MQKVLLLIAGVGAVVAITGGFTGSRFLTATGAIVMLIALILLPWLDERSSWRGCLAVLCAGVIGCGGAEPPAARSAAAAAAGVSPDARHSLDGRIGVAQEARDGSYCLSIANAAVPTGTPVLLVTTHRPVRVDTARVESERGEACTAPGDEWGHAVVADAAFYTLRLARGAEPMRPNIAVVGRATLRAEGDSVVVADLDGDGRAERFGACASHEGVHLSVATGAVRRWHAYFYVPYDLEPDCPDESP